MSKESAPTENLVFEEKEEEKTAETFLRAKSLVENNDFFKALHCLEEEGLLAQQVLNTQMKYTESLENADFLTSKDWEYLTIISLYSPELLTHCVETYQLIRSKIENISIGSGTLAEIIQTETGTLDTFYRATILHDIGKTAIPESVLNHTVEPGDWQTLAHCDPEQKDVFKELVQQDALTFQEFDFVEYLSEYDLNQDSTTPARTFLSENEIGELEQKGISPDLTLREIRELHEINTRQILQDAGLQIEALIAGQHHNYNNEPYHYPTSSQSLGIAVDLSDLLHIGDVQEALTSTRPYINEPFTHIGAYYILYKDAEKGKIKNKELVALWIQNGLEQEQFDTNSEKELEKIEQLKLFVQKYNPNSK